jgi:L-lactate dehydrogenase complex protein LldF
VKIDLDGQLFRWRQHVTEAGYVSGAKRLAVTTSVKVLDRPRVFRAAGALARLGLRIMPTFVARFAAGAWGRAREVPPAPAQSFRAWYRKNGAKRR